jgi:capsular polysaccharide biosynthesis protein
MVNEAELEARLVEAGFILVRPEQLKVAEQARQFSAACCVVAPHGAGLANIVFAPPGAALVEVFHPQYRHPCYENLAAACGHRYVGLPGCAMKGEPLAFTVDVEEILRSANTML